LKIGFLDHSHDGLTLESPSSEVSESNSFPQTPLVSSAMGYKASIFALLGKKDVNKREKRNSEEEEEVKEENLLIDCEKMEEKGRNMMENDRIGDENERGTVDDDEIAQKESREGTSEKNPDSPDNNERGIEDYLKEKLGKKFGTKSTNRKWIVNRKCEEGAVKLESEMKKEEIWQENEDFGWRNIEEKSTQKKNIKIWMMNKPQIQTSRRESAESLDCCKIKEKISENMKKINLCEDINLLIQVFKKSNTKQSELLGLIKFYSNTLKNFFFLRTQKNIY
jgi:hypothetical protein